MTKILMTYGGAYDDYQETYWYLNDGALLDEEIKIIFKQAKLLEAQYEIRYEDRLVKLFIKYDRRDLIGHGTFIADSDYARGNKIDRKLCEEVEKVDKERRGNDWENLVEEASKGRIKLMVPEREFSYDGWE